MKGNNVLKTVKYTYMFNSYVKNIFWLNLSNYSKMVKKYHFIGLSFFNLLYRRTICTFITFIRVQIEVSLSSKRSNITSFTFLLKHSRDPELSSRLICSETHSQTFPRARDIRRNPSWSFLGSQAIFADAARGFIWPKQVSTTPASTTSRIWDCSANCAHL